MKDNNNICPGGFDISAGVSLKATTRLLEYYGVLAS